MEIKEKALLCLQASRIATINQGLAKLQEQVVDLQNCVRRGTIRIRGVREGLEGSNMAQFLITWWSGLFPDLNLNISDIARAHRSLTMRRDSQQFPRDIIVAFDRYTMKTKIFAALCTKADLSLEGRKIIVLQDIAPETLRLCQKFKPYMSLIQSANLKFRWGFPCSIIVNFRGKQLNATTPEEAEILISELGLNNAQQLQNKHTLDSTPPAPDQSTRQQLPQ
uniref:Uncharacterized protein n=1 Tax=Salvator merianae TaxID=96440 RepID=A0A8D0AZB7_SALMN